MNTGNTLIIDAFWVSNKSFPTMQHPNTYPGQIFHDYYYGNARHLGWMDLCQLKSIIQKHKINHLILQNLDALGKISDVVGEVKVCVAYNYHRFRIVKSVSEDKELVHCDPIYESVVFGGWDFPENGKVPFRAQRYMQYLLTHTRVNSITCFTNKLKVTASFDKNGQIEFSSEPNS